MIYIHCIYTVDNSDLRYICQQQIQCVLSLGPNSPFKADSDAPDLQDEQSKVALPSNDHRMFTGYYSQKHPEPCHI